jgi:hypothetical protein
MKNMVFIKLSDFDQVVAGKTSTLNTKDCDGYMVHALHFRPTNITKAQFDRIRIATEGRDHVDHLTGTWLQNFNTWKNRPNVATELVFYFGNPEMKSERDQHLFDLDLSRIKTASGDPAQLHIEVDVDAACVGPALIVWAECYAPKAQQGNGQMFADFEGDLTKWYTRKEIVAAGAYANQGIDIDLKPSSYAALINEFWFGATGKITSLGVKIGTDTKFDNVPQSVADDLYGNYAHTAVASMFVYSPTYKGHVSGALPVVSPQGTALNFKHLLTSSAGDTFDIFCELAAKYEFVK